MTTEVDSIKISGITKAGVHAIRLTLGDKTLTMYPGDALDLSKQL